MLSSLFCYLSHRGPCAFCACSCLLSGTPGAFNDTHTAESTQTPRCFLQSLLPPPQLAVFRIRKGPAIRRNLKLILKHKEPEPYTLRRAPIYFTNQAALNTHVARYFFRNISSKSCWRIAHKDVSTGSYAISMRTNVKKWMLGHTSSSGSFSSSRREIEADFEGRT